MLGLKNHEINNYREKSICDAHIHLHVKASLDETIEIFRNIKNHFNYERFALQALPSYDVTNNYEALYYKTKYDGVYAGVGIMHHFDERDTASFYLEQAKAFYKMGCDGFKLLEGKPDYRKKLGKPLDHNSFDKFYQFAEEKGLPILLHFGDPRYYWDEKNVPQWVIDRGWFYDESFLSFDESRDEVVRVLNKFPKLKLILAHFFFVSDDIEYAYNFMEKYKNVCFDITPGPGMFDNFDKNPEEWRKFFIKYSDRILYGTDIYNWHLEDKTVEDKYSHAVNLVRCYLERKDSFYNKWRDKEFENPFGFEDEILDKIYHDNFIRLYGNKPRELDREMLVSECKRLVSNYDLDVLQISNMNQIISELSVKKR